ncbi:RING/FYVE/PHD zinc finger superfamily protein, putative isoform 2 [Hibiscus syriacus]|uniref:RING/FYVE/PHD zinc finger superfamily protein, putative isoform 2 n=1 Tax=Hibiscus syriacus TaxID=106335 RepID=A0A6A3ADB6_HIBSY|nr:uncharacterized protein LOC120129666 [Hibiscus syriacus]XP_039003051.1 uncharacterized protein LOC120129666 [Hibiscus syriacus]KAE8702038.1 RING/FYVE/PHD zinc finger superfamily protein, putative isoform 2 [Hibiscus syriacus]
MDPEVAVDGNAAFEPSPTAGEKRGIENGDVSGSKKRHCHGGLKRVTEIVLVLSTMGKMRGGGRDPTAAEMALMLEARETLAQMCGEMAPKDIVRREAIGNAIEELGLNSKLREQRLGFRGTGMSISQKVLLAKMKMEEPKKFTTPATYVPQSVQTNVGGSAENRGATHTVRVLPSDQPIHATVSSVTAAGSTPLQHQLPTGDIKMATMSTGVPSGHLGNLSSFAYPRVERPQIKLDGVSNVASYVSHVPANSSASHSLTNAPAWSMQAQPAALAKSGQENKVFTHNPTKVEGSTGSTMAQMTPQAVRDQTFRPFITQTATGTFRSVHQPVQGVNFTQAPPFTNNHSEIARIVQKLLQPKLPANPTWTPPSREYTNKAVTCQTCKLTINEVENVLLCDACEKGFHLKCLQPKGIPRGEWHCARCLSFCNGKPLPLKYGRVMRSINVPKVPSSSAEVLSSSETKVENLGPLINHEKVTENGSSALQTPAVSTTVDSNYVESASGSKVPKANSTKPSEAVCDTPVGMVTQKAEEPSQMTESSKHEERNGPTTSHTVDTSSNTINDKAEHSQPSHINQDIPTEKQNSAEIPSNDCHGESSGVKKLEKGSEGDIDFIKQIDQTEQDAAAAQVNPTANYEANTEISRHPEFSSDGLRAVEWAGDVLQVVDEKKFYQSCCIDGVTYKVHDHALVHFGQDKLIPSKLQAMWEDAKTGMKWVVVKRCYCPSDLPEGVAHPCAPETSEVYESNNDSTVMASSIQCPCEVLPATKFKEEGKVGRELKQMKD